MPVVDGPTFRERQLSDPQLSSIPVIVLSAYRGVAKRAAELNVEDHLDKPLKLSALLGLMQKHCPLGASADWNAGAELRLDLESLAAADGVLAPRRLSNRVGIGRAAPSCAPLAWRRATGRRRCAAWPRRRAWARERARRGGVVPFALERAFGGAARVCGTARAACGAPAPPRTPAPPSAACGSTRDRGAAASAARRRDAPRRGRSRSPAWSSARRASPGGCDPSPRARTRPPPSTGSSPARDLAWLCRQFPCVAYRKT